MSIDELTAKGYTVKLSPVPPTGPQPIRAIRCELWLGNNLASSAETPVAQPSSANLAAQEATTAINAAWDAIIASIDF